MGELARLEKVYKNTKDKGRAIAYRKAITSIKASNKPIFS